MRLSQEEQRFLNDLKALTRILIHIINNYVIPKGDQIMMLGRPKQCKKLFGFVLNNELILHEQGAFFIIRGPNRYLKIANREECLKNFIKREI